MGEAVLSGLRWGGVVPAPWLMQQKDLVGALGCCEHFRVADGFTSQSLPGTEVPKHTLHEWLDLMAPRTDTLKRLWGLMGYG